MLGNDASPCIRVTDEQAKIIIEKYSKCKTVSEFQKLDTKAQHEFISIFKQRGISIRQISRLTGITKGIVEKQIKG